MKTQESLDSIVSDEQSLELDCRIIIPKFKKAEYDTFSTEVDTSVLNRVMQIRSNSQEFKFKQSPTSFVQTQFSKTEKKIQCTLLNDNEYSIQLGVKLEIQPLLSKNVSGKQERKQQKQVNQSQSGNNQLKQNQNFPTQKKQSNNHLNQINDETFIQIRQPIQRQEKRQLSQTYNPAKVEVSPLKVSRFSQRQIYVTQLVTCQKESLEEKLNLVQMENNEKISRKSLSPYSKKNKTVHKQIDLSQIKGILKSRSCNSEDGRRNRSPRDPQIVKKSGFEKQQLLNHKHKQRNQKLVNLKEKYISISQLFNEQLNNLYSFN